MLEDASPPEPAAVEVSGVLYHEVVLAFGQRETKIKAAVKGPLRIEERKVKGVTEIVLVNQLTGSQSALPSTPADLERFKETHRDPGGPDGADGHQGSRDDK